MILETGASLTCDVLSSWSQYTLYYIDSITFLSSNTLVTLLKLKLTAIVKPFSVIWEYIFSCCQVLILAYLHCIWTPVLKETHLDRAIWYQLYQYVATTWPSRHTNSKQRCIDATSWCRVDVDTTLFRRHVPAGWRLGSPSTRAFYQWSFFPGTIRW